MVGKEKREGQKERKNGHERKNERLTDLQANMQKERNKDAGWFVKEKQGRGMKGSYLRSGNNNNVHGRGRLR